MRVCLGDLKNAAKFRCVSREGGRNQLSRGNCLNGGVGRLDNW